MKHLDSIESFYNSLKDIAIENLDLDKKRELLRKYVYDYNNNIQKISIEKSLKKQNKEIEKLLNETIDILKVSSNKWVANFDKILEKEKFRSDLENYFIIIIFGKVKAGKSSLGNFIAQKRPTNEKVSFFKYDEVGKEESIKKLEEIEDDSFDTDNLECTVAIQGFKLSAMAWIDTPGLGSMVEENGKLAREYIEAADYIIYPTSSDSPLQADEISQLKELFEQNKKVTICITKSDKFERKKDKGGKYIKKDGKLAKFLINKLPENRLKQEQYVKEEISKINQNQSLLGDIISISAHTAKLGLDEKNQKLFENSNIPKFYEIITKVVKKKATKLKSETPYNGLKSFIDNDVLGISDREFTIKMIRAKINDLDKNINEIVGNLNILIENIKSDTHREVNCVVEKYYTDINKHNSEEILKKINAEIAENISKVIELSILKVFESFR
jgi:tRNA U34 5-carboxymethylaminomethyl modifying GTPase MnmE/TrmE